MELEVQAQESKKKNQEKNKEKENEKKERKQKKEKGRKRVRHLLDMRTKWAGGQSLRRFWVGGWSEKNKGQRPWEGVNIKGYFYSRKQTQC